MAVVTYTVYYEVVTHSGREFRVTSTVDIETPPTDPGELETALLVKLLDRNPDARSIEIVSFTKGGSCD